MMHLASWWKENYKVILYWILMLFLGGMMAWNYKEFAPKTQKPLPGIHTIEVGGETVSFCDVTMEGCQYFAFHMYGAGPTLTHKGNCTNLIHKVLPNNP